MIDKTLVAPVLSGLRKLKVWVPEEWRFVAGTGLVAGFFVRAAFLDSHPRSLLIVYFLLAFAVIRNSQYKNPRYRRSFGLLDFLFGLIENLATWDGFSSTLLFSTACFVGSRVALFIYADGDLTSR
jgi:hypothetical protein